MSIVEVEFVDHCLIMFSLHISLHITGNRGWEDAYGGLNNQK